MNHVGPLNAEKMGAAVLLYAFNIGFPTSLLREEPLYREVNIPLCFGVREGGHIPLSFADIATLPTS